MGSVRVLAVHQHVILSYYNNRLQQQVIQPVAAASTKYNLNAKDQMQIRIKLLCNRSKKTQIQTAEKARRPRVGNDSGAGCLTQPECC